MVATAPMMAESNWKNYSSIKNKFNISVIWKVFDSFTTNYKMNQITNHKSFHDFKMIQIQITNPQKRICNHDLIC